MPVFTRVTLVALVGLALTGCGGPTQEVAPAVVEAVALQVPEAAAALQAVDQSTPLGAVEVYVDLSMSMRPYLGAGSGVDQSALYYRVLEQLNDDLGGDVRFFGFGFLRDSTRQTLDPLRDVGVALNPASYARLNNDYAAVFSAFAADSTRPLPTRVVLTDGVESDPEGGRRFGGIVAAADDWVRAGGVFAALVFRTPYDGRYFPEAAACAGTGLPMTCPDRPLVAFVLAPDAHRLNRLVAVMAAGGVTPTYTLRVGAGDDLTLTPTAALPPPPDARRETRLLRDVETVFVPGYRAFQTARVDTRAIASGFYPLTFDTTIPADAPWGRLPAEEQVAFLETLRPVVRAWAVEARRDSVVLHPVAPHIREARVEVATDSTGRAQLRTVIPVQRPEPPTDAEGRPISVRQYAWLVSLVPYESGQLLVPDDLSTVNDCSVNACNRTLNLAPMLGAILRDDYVPGHALLLTEWRD